MLKFEKPDYKIKEYVEDSFYGKFVLEPLERGFGLTIGNALRRILLSSLPGDAITSVRIDGVMHEFQTIEGVIEDVTSIVLNLKKIVVKKNTEEQVTVKISAKGEGTLTAASLMTDSTIEVINPEQEICTLAEGGKLDMELTIGRGRGYIVADEVLMNHLSILQELIYQSYCFVQHELFQLHNLLFQLENIMHLLR